MPLFPLGHLHQSGHCSRCSRFSRHSEHDLPPLPLALGHKEGLDIKTVAVAHPGIKVSRASASQVIWPFNASHSP